MTTPINDRQHPKGATADLGIANIGTGNGVTIAIPVNALLVRMFAVTITAFNSSSTNTLTAGDGTTTFVNGVDIKTTGSETVSNTPKFYPTGGTITVSLADTGEMMATAGRVMVVVEYYVLNNGDAGIYTG